MMTPSQFQEAIGTLDKDKATLWCGPMLAAMERAKVDTPLRQAHFLAQIAHESGSLRWLREIPPQGKDAATHFEIQYGWKTQRGKNLGNVNPGDGGRYFGRGPLQCTGRNNYREFGVWEGIDALNQPQLLEEPVHSANFCAWFWMAKGINRFADADDIEAVTRKVNGGLTHIEDRRTRLKLVKQALNISAETAALLAAVKVPE